jgi:biopolymer transport protein ExbB
MRETVRNAGQSAGRTPWLVLLLACLIALGLGSAAPAAAAAENQGWWNKDWSYRKSVTIDTGPSGINVSGAIGRTVVLVRLHSGNFTFTDAMPNGADIRFVDSDNKTPLPFHIEKFDPTNGLAAVWVAVPNLNGGEKHVIWLYFGNKSAPVGSDEKGTFDPDTMAAYHFGENPGQPSTDSTANANNAKGAPAGIDDGGIIGKSARFPGQGQIEIPASGSLAMPAAAPFTFSAWVKPDQLAGTAAIFQRGGLTIGLNAGVPFVAGPGVTLQGKTALKQGDWAQVAFTADGTTTHLYVNGIEAANGSGALGAVDGSIFIGGAAGQPFNGELDEVRLSKTARPAGQILAMHEAEGQGGKLVSVTETAEKQSSGGGVFFFVLSKLEGVDEIVVGLCLALFSLAAFVMVNKFRYLALCTKANAAFMRQFRRMDTDLVPSTEIPGLDRKEAALIRAAPLAHIYDVGIEEFNRRKKRWGSQPLSSQAIDAMRAATTEVVVHENHKLDAWMVILTIAISGGPFIGLLGTVMGVMNTFGGVAMAGDVNVNAIAPGIAAALLATISGLFCAIPSLFGYNYLNSRLVPIASDMGVFIDQLITRLAEMQADEATELEMMGGNGLF